MPQKRIAAEQQRRQMQNQVRRREPTLLQKFFAIRIPPALISFFGWGIAGVAAIAIAFWFFTGLFVNNSFEVFLDGEHIGYMPISEELTSEAFHDYAVLNLQAANGHVQVQVNERVTIEETRTSRRNRAARGDIVAILNRRFTYTITAFEIHVNGQFEALMRTPNDLNHAEYLLQEKWFNENTVHAEFVSGWEVIPIQVDSDFNDYCTPEQAFWRLDREVRQLYEYTIVRGDTLGSIAVRFGTRVDHIMLDNNLTSTNIFPGDVLQIYTLMPLLAVRTYDELRTDELIEMPVETRHNPALPQAHQQVIQEGRAGQQVSVLRIERVNGTERSRTVLDAEIIIEPITHIIEVGTGAVSIERR
jgi:hypothetical protein